MKHLKLIDGLRAYLALWVFSDHVLGWCGIDSNYGNPVVVILREGMLAVNIFIIISGLVIFSLLDRREENYRQFICRRFFRLYPLFIILFVVSLPLSSLERWCLVQPNNHMDAYEVGFGSTVLQAARGHPLASVVLHLTMLHGVMPDSSLGGYPRLGFLGPAWSISLEWQFYLLAPLLFWAAVKSNTTRSLLGVILAGLCVAGLLATWGDGFLPLNLFFFIVGGGCYFVHKWLRKNPGLKQAKSWAFAALLALGLAIFTTGRFDPKLLPLCLWLPFFALLVTPLGSWPARFVAPLFNNPVAQYLGKISYSIYLCHEPILTLVNAALLRFVPSLGSHAHLFYLYGIALVLVILASSLLYRFIEKAGIACGRKLVRQM